MINMMCMECSKFKKGCEGTEVECYTGCIFRQTDAELLKRYQVALKKIGTLNIFKLPEPIKDILKQATNLDQKVVLLEEIAKNK